MFVVVCRVAFAVVVVVVRFACSCPFCVPGYLRYVQNFDWFACMLSFVVVVAAAVSVITIMILILLLVLLLMIIMIKII